MAGHSKWANIQHRKGAQDARRGKVFTRVIREISIAARTGGSDPSFNPRLRAAIDKAQANNMPKDTVERAIKRGTGALDSDNFEEVRYEGYGPGGVAVMVDCLTDNRQRTVGDVRHAFTKCGGNLGTSNSVSYLFAKTGVISFPAASDEGRIMEVALEAGADDVVTNPDASVDVLTAPEAFIGVKQAILDAGLAPELAEVTMRAAVNIPLGIEDARKMVKLLEMLEELDDVQNVYSNADLSEEILAQIA
jgi:YebC/PmpR family DNA-binding regulatory protein